MAALDFLIGVSQGSMAARAYSRPYKEALFNQAVRECAKHDRCDSQEMNWLYGEAMTDAELEASNQFWGEFKAKSQCKKHHECLVAESSVTQETYTYHADMEEPARTWW